MQWPVEAVCSIKLAALLPRDLGRFRLGDFVPLLLNISQAPKSVPTATASMISSSGSQEPADIPAITSDATVFATDYRLGIMSLGAWLIRHQYLDASGALVQGANLINVVGGGDSSGRVISLFCFDRPEDRQILAQLESGALVSGRNPHL